MRLRFAVLAATFLPIAAFAASPREELKTLTSQLQKAPSDDALRGKIIVLAKKVKPAPAVPEDARRALIRGNTAFAAAKDPSGFPRAIERFEEASILAPWWAEPYFNLAKACEGAQDFDRALRALKYYGATAATEADKRQGLDLAYALEEKRDLKKADAVSASKDAAAKARAESSIEGAWWGEGNSETKPWFTVTRKGDGFELTSGTSGTLTDIQTTETTLKLVYQIMAKQAVDLHREGEFLIGEQWSVYHGRETTAMSLRLVRKP
ncbi:MAG: hypothetical protein ABL955_10025 [Elusimicrobiota bacterium]